MTIKVHHKILLVLGFVLLVVAAVFFSVKCQTVGTVLSVLGSIASLYAIVEALVRIKSIKDETRDIKQALSVKVESLNRKETTEQINKHVEVISRMQGYISARNHEAAVILMEQLLVFLQALRCNPTTEASDKEEIARIIKQFKTDMNNVRCASGLLTAGTGLNYKTLTKHFTDIEDFLTQVSQQNHFRDDQ